MLSASLVAILTMDCTALPRDTERVALDDVSTIPGLETVRGAPSPLGGTIRDNFDASFAQESAAGTYPPDANSTVHCASLVLSGGADYGAFGVGVLAGWTETGTRPEFKVVTGVSTGAMIASVAVLGPVYEEALQESFTTIDQDDFLTLRGIFDIILGTDAVADSRPLQRPIAAIYDMKVMQRVAEEHNRGRHLYILTTNIDTEVPILWSLGALANVGTREALDLSRKIITASVSPPGVFPPVLIDAVVNGELYQEMHADSGVVTSMMSTGGIIDFTDTAQRLTSVEAAAHDVHLIRNGFVTPRPRVV